MFNMAALAISAKKVTVAKYLYFLVNTIAGCDRVVRKQFR
jgi:hypothetical protein